MALGNVSGIVIKHSLLLNDVPDPADLEVGELALNANSGSLALFTKDETGAIQPLGGGGGTGSAKVTHGTTAPANPSIGDIFIDITDPAAPEIKVNATGGWMVVAAVDGVTVVHDPVTGDIGVGVIDMGIM